MTTSKQLTVGGLKGRLARYPDDTAVLVMVNDDDEGVLMGEIDSVASYGEDDFEYMQKDAVIPNVTLVIEVVE